MADDDIVVEKWGPGLAEDRRNGTLLRGALYHAWDRDEPSWAICEKRGNFPVVALLHGRFARSPGAWAVTVTITHSHRDGYFPFRDSLYDDELPLDRFTLMLQAAQRSSFRNGVKVPVVVVDEREAHRAEHERLARGEDPGQVRLRNWRGPSSGHTDLDITERARLQSPLVSGEAVVVLAVPDGEVSYDEATGTVRDPRTGLGMRLRREGDRDYYYEAATIVRGEEPVAELALHRRDCWRPGYGPSQLVHLNRATGEDLPLHVLVPLLNRHPGLFGDGEHLGHGVVVDTRSEPLGYYYG